MKLDLKSSPRHIKRLQNIAKVISGLGDVRVVIDDNTKGPYFDPVNKVCVLPNGDYSDDDFVSLIEGFTCHEAGHGRYTVSEFTVTPLIVFSCHLKGLHASMTE